jgi:hypothetical protein
MTSIAKRKMETQLRKWADRKEKKFDDDDRNIYTEVHLEKLFLSVFYNSMEEKRLRSMYVW